MKNRTIVTCVLFLLLTAGVFANIKQTLKIKFESKYEVAGQKFSLKQLGLAPSAQWDKYQYLVLEMKASSSQRFQIGFNTDWGYNELRIMPYAVGEWSRVCIPLHLYREKPKPSHDLASLNNIPSVMAWYNLGSYPRGKLSNVDSIGIRMQAPINNPTLEITAIYFSDKKIEDKYLGKQYLIDEFGQWNLGDYEGKIHSLKELKETWRKEEETVNSGKSQENYSKFGGFLNARVDNGTGFFRTLKQDGRWWFVDPEGYLFLSLGVDCISPEGGTVAKMLDKRVGVYKEIPPKNIPNAPNTMAFGVWNMYRRYGDNWLESWKKMTLKRMDNWGINTIANWSSPSIIETNQKAFMLGLEVGHLGGEIMGLSNIYSPDFKQKIEQAVKEQTSNYKQNPWLIGWFTGNEPAWLGEEIRLTDLILQSKDSNFKEALRKYLVPLDIPERRKQFVYDTFHTFLKTVDNALKKYDPNHLHIGTRLGQSEIPSDEILDICKDVYDVYSFNSYSLAPSKAYMDKVAERTGLPLIIGEFHFGTTDRGMAQSLWQVDNQKERGVAYRYYVENGYSHPALIGTAYFTWSDQSITGRVLDGENYNCGLVDVADIPYPYQVQAMTESAHRIYDIHKGNIAPTKDTPKRARGYGMTPNQWNK